MMLARNRKIRLKGKKELSGPLLVPRVSSKGFPLGENDLAESGIALERVSQVFPITEALLVSAYDLHHRKLPDCDRLLSEEHQKTIYATSQLLIVDSGSYEMDPLSFEGGETKRDPYTPEAFTRENFEAVVRELPADRDLLVVSYVKPGPGRPTYKEQREKAQRFFAEHNHVGRDFLLMPQNHDRLLNVDELTPVARDLEFFDVIGVTEKELGTTLLDRLVMLARLRKLLDDKGCKEKPIHVFGTLDPALTPLYFMAGTEIFDGLSWLQYAYFEGLSISPDEWSVLPDGMPDARQGTLDLQRYSSNLKEIAALKRGLNRWANEPGEYTHLGPRHERLRKIYKTMLAVLAQEGLGDES
jgi:hypothetical protein